MPAILLNKKNTTSLCNARVPKSHAATQIRYPPYGKAIIRPETTAKWTNVRGSRKTQGADESGFSNPESGTRIRHDLELLDEIIQKA
jgi:hypothetical protein